MHINDIIASWCDQIENCNNKQKCIFQHYFYIIIHLPNETTQDNMRNNKIHIGEEQNTQTKRRKSETINKGKNNQSPI
jgi:hypothetical protein